MDNNQFVFNTEADETDDQENPFEFDTTPVVRRTPKRGNGFWHGLVSFIAIFVGIVIEATSKDGYMIASCPRCGGNNKHYRDALFYELVVECKHCHQSYRIDSISHYLIVGYGALLVGVVACLIVVAIKLYKLQ